MHTRLHLGGAAGNNKLRRHLHPFKRLANAHQVAPRAPGARHGIHKYNALCLAQKCGKVTHEFVMLTNATSAVNVIATSRRALLNSRYTKTRCCIEISKKNPYSEPTNPLTANTLSTPTVSTLCYMLSP